MEDNLQALGENSSLRDEFIVPVFVYSPFPKGGGGGFFLRQVFLIVLQLNRPATNRSVIARKSSRLSPHVA